ncbi:MBL fold metallo-hydrolase [Deinococcus planocerae]|uniref:MBL fold metallo-hydrolase n=1 Tax=Deinococcus planocerae TaxID=1737569 RepID=UPI000C7F3983|nr:MBL fold metallo-hydrolase [Deinococcus planocerae]
MTAPDAAVRTLDLHFQGVPGVIAASVFETGDGLAVVDVGPGSTLPELESGLASLGASLADVRHVFLTHIHLDHAGATGTILDRVPGARAYVHERGAAHLSRPGRLLASAAQIYGGEMDRLWGEMRPVEPGRLTVLAGGETLRVGRLEVRPLYTPGHAVHHLAYHAGDDLFVGDVGGIRLSERQTPRAPTPPPDIDLPAWRESVAALRGLGARTLHLAHFGASPDSADHWDGLLASLDVDAARVREGLERGQDAEELTGAFTRALLDELRGQDPELPGRYEFACPPWMSVQGLVRYWTRAAARGRATGDGG